MTGAAGPRVAALADSLNLTVDDLVTLLETHDLHLLSGPAMREEMDFHALRSALRSARDFITGHPAVTGQWPLLIGIIDSALGRTAARTAPTPHDPGITLHLPLPVALAANIMNLVDHEVPGTMMSDLTTTDGAMFIPVPSS